MLQLLVEPCIQSKQVMWKGGTASSVAKSISRCTFELIVSCKLFARSTLIKVAPASHSQGLKLAWINKCPLRFEHAPPKPPRALGESFAAKLLICNKAAALFPCAVIGDMAGWQANSTNAAPLRDCSERRGHKRG